MAECTVTRCSHERRVFRKELHKWSKEILYILGLERLAEELMGARKWKILVQPFTELESKNPVDWYPEETCYFCSAKKQPLYDPASGIIPTVEGYSSLRIDTDEQSTSSDPGNLVGSFTSCSTSLPWHITTLSSPVLNSPPLPDRPLDLSITSKQPANESVMCSTVETPHSFSTNNYNESDSFENSVLKVPQISLKPGYRRRLDANSKRSYTDEELQAALRDIQSGKLGTRRAAVIYGIPRSTLRNKVYKLANESKNKDNCKIMQNTGHVEKEQQKTIRQSSCLETSLYDCVNNKQNVTSASESLRQLLKQTITQKVQNTFKNTDDKITSSDLSDKGAASHLNLLENLEYSQALAPVLSQVFSDIHHLALVKSKENINCTTSSLSALNDDLKLPLLPDLIRRLAEERVDFERDSCKDSDSANQNDLEELHSGAQCNVILKVPSFKPAKSSMNTEVDDPSLPVLPSSVSPPGSSSHTHSGNKGITVSLKELIAKSIGHKMNYKNEEETVQYSFSSDMDRSSNISWMIDSTTKDEKEGLVNANNSSCSDNSKAEKRTRPKRGRYRNYDRDNLARAVRAVQKGEMSVHRAGTFYGVPHSTLEYKVKERHLLRPKKKETLSSFSDIMEPVTTSKAIHSCDIENSISVKNLKNNLNQFPVEASNCFSADTEEPHRPSADSYPSHLSFWQNMPFLSLDFSQFNSENFFASQMMRKLQENAKLNEESQKLKKGQNVGILETLIKSTLERSISPESKSAFILSTDCDLADLKKTSNDGK